MVALTRRGRSGLSPAGRIAVTCAAVAVLAAADAATSLLRWNAPGSAPAPGSQLLADWAGGVGRSAAAAAAAGSFLLRALRERGRLRAAWCLFAASSLAASLGYGGWAWYELVLRRPAPALGPADWAFLFFGPFAVVAALVYRAGAGTRPGRVKLLLDGTMIAGALFSAAWTPALAREAASGGAGPVRAALALGYPLLVVLLADAVLAIRSTGGRPEDRASMAALLLGYGIIALRDGAWAAPRAQAGYASGRLLDSGWFLGYLVLALAPWLTRWTEQRQRRKRARRRLRARAAAAVRRAGELTAVVLPYAAGTVCLAEIMVRGLTGDHRVSRPLLASGGIVLAALVARQAVALLENHALQRQLLLRENHFRSLVQGSSDVIMTVDPAGTLGYVSPAVARVFGYDPDSLTTSSLYGLVHAEDRASVAQAVERFLNGWSEAETLECRIRAAIPAPVGGTSAADAVPAARGGDEPTRLAEDWRHTECTLTRHRGGLVFTCRDVSDRVALQRRLTYNAYHDPLTGLANRALFTDRLEQALAQPEITREPVALLFLDLDDFKAVNDGAGHAIGDALLIEAAARMHRCIGPEDTLARFGGDEFAALVACGPDGAAARAAGERLRAALAAPFDLAGRRFRVGASVGMAFWRPGCSAAGLMREADLAMYDAKSAGKGRLRERSAAPVSTALGTRVPGPCAPESPESQPHPPGTPPGRESASPQPPSADTAYQQPSCRAEQARDCRPRECRTCAKPAPMSAG